MGVYYYFNNDTNGAENKFPIPGYEPMTWVANFNYLPQEKMIAIFEAVIQANGWNTTDEFSAIPDDGVDRHIIIFTNGKMRYFDPDEEDEEEWRDEEAIEERYWKGYEEVEESCSEGKIMVETLKISGNSYWNQYEDDY